MNLSTKEKCTIRDLIKIELRSLDKEVTIEWTSRKGNPSSKVVKLPHKTRSQRKGK